MKFCESTLRGLIPKVPLACDDVMTHANFYIRDQVPFDLLLGGPWQRGNYVSIDEREGGTYLLFKDENLEVRHELLVTPEEGPTSLEETGFIDWTRKARPSVNTILSRRNQRKRQRTKKEASLRNSELTVEAVNEAMPAQERQGQHQRQCDRCARDLAGPCSKPTRQRDVVNR